jgi:outer membrane immunogenic protein
VRARAGVAWNQFLFYGTGGYAAGNVNLYDSSHYAAGVTETADVKQTLSGWAAGAGVEWAFAEHWTLKGEYLHVDLGSATTHSTLLPAFNVGYFHSHDITAEIGRVGLNYKF